VDAVLALQVAVGVRSGDLETDVAIAGDVAGGLVQHLDLVAPLLGPAQVHPQEHRGPVASFAAAGSRVDLDQGGPVVVLTAQQGVEFVPVQVFEELDGLAFRLGQQLFVGFAGEHLEYAGDLLLSLDEGFVGCESVSEPSELL
jgi:hypothetical protein